MSLTHPVLHRQNVSLAVINPARTMGQPHVVHVELTVSPSLTHLPHQSISLFALSSTL